MSKMIGNKGKKNLAKALSAFLLVLNLTQIPTSAVKFRNDAVGAQGTIGLRRVELESEEAQERLGRKLSELCNEFGVTRGIDFGDGIDGCEKSPYQYFFEGTTAKFREISPATQLRFAQVITVMDDHKDDADWHDSIKHVLIVLAAHGEHCSWRAQSLVDQAYIILKKCAIDHARMPEMDKLVLELKETILPKASDACPDERVQDCEFSDKSELIKKAHAMLMGRYGADYDSMNRELFSDVNRMGMSFAAYCNLVGKTQVDIENMVAAIASEECEDDELKAWTNGERELTLEKIKDKLVAEILDLDAAGCSELSSWAGIKFLAKCYNERYFED